MKLGMGLYPHLFTDDNFRFAKQLSVSHIVAHLPGEETFPSAKEGIWSYDDLNRFKSHINRFGLELAAIENFDPRHWDKILLGRPERTEQIENVKTTIRNMGKAGIPVMGYNFSLAGVWGRYHHDNLRGNAQTVAFDYDRDEVKNAGPIPNGEIWGRKIDDNPPPGDIGNVTKDQLWERMTFFLNEIIPVAEEAGVRLALHPEDPPVPVLRGSARLAISPDDYRRVLSIKPSYNNALEFCQGTITEMGVDVYETIRYFSSRNNIAYVHFRNVRGKIPRYDEVFIDDGDVDMLKAMQLYAENGFDGVIIPDHTPSTSCAAPWHAGMAFALGFMRAAIRMAGAEE